MKKSQLMSTFSAYLSVLVFLTGMAFSAEGALVNGSFENGLVGYSGSTNGQGGVVQTIANGVITPTDGNNFLYLTTGPGDIGSDGAVDNVTPGIRLDFTVDVGAEIMMFDFNILTDENIPSDFFNDRARSKLNGICAACGDTEADSIWYRNDTVSVGNQTTISDAFNLINNSGGITASDGTHYSKQTDWYTTYIDFSGVAGLGITQDLIFTVTEAQNSHLLDTALLVDNIRFVSSSPIPTPNPVPIPAAVWLFGTALVGLVGFTRRMKAA